MTSTKGIRAPVPLLLALGVSLLTATGGGAQEIVVPPGANDVPNKNLKVLPAERFRTFGEILPAMHEEGLVGQLASAGLFLALAVIVARAGMRKVE